MKDNNKPQPKTKKSDYLPPPAPKPIKGQKRKELTDREIEAWAEENAISGITREAMIFGAKAHRDNKISK